MRLTTRYILRQMFNPFLFGVGAFTSIFVGTDVIFRIAELVSRWGAPLGLAGRFFFLSLPQIIVYTFPMASLLAALLAFSRLSSSGEVTAMKAGGLSFYRMIVPVVAVGLLVSLMTVLINETVVPYATRTAHDIEWEIRHGRSRIPTTQSHLRLFDTRGGEPRFILYARKFNGETGTMHGIELSEFENGDLSRLVRAESADWRETGWDFQNGTIYNIAEHSPLPQMTFESYTLNLGRTPQDIRREQLRPGEMTFGELRDHIAVQRRGGDEPHDLVVELHHKLAIPLASLIFALVGAPLGLKPARSGSSIGLGLSIVVIFIYYAMMTLGTALAQGGSINPVLGAWVQNAVFLCVGVGMIVRAAR